MERRGVIAFYGCFMKSGTQVNGVFADETELDITVRTYYGGEVMLVPLAEQECDTAPSASPTDSPTFSPRPTVPLSNHGYERKIANGLMVVTTSFSLMVFFMLL